MPTARKFLLKYSQYHIDASLTGGVRAATGGSPVIEYNGAAEFWVDRLEDFGAIFQDPHYLEVVVPDEQKFIQREAGVILVGEDHVKWDGGKPVAGVNL